MSRTLAANRRLDSPDHMHVKAVSNALEGWRDEPVPLYVGSSSEQI
jgi:hypothetical protein